MAHKIRKHALPGDIACCHGPGIKALNCCVNVWGGGDYYIGANQAGKRARSLFNCISVTDGIKINEQIKSIGIGPLYLHTEFEVI